MPPNPLSRRRLLQGGALAAAAFGLGSTGQLLAQAGRRDRPHSGYGPLAPVRDCTTGLPLLQLPQGFSYRSFGWAGAAMDDGAPTPDNHDGMGIVAAQGDVLTLVRNHEVTAGWGSFAPAASTWDPRCAGGTTTLRFDTARGELVSARPSLSGTLTNCAGGVTPWGSWLSCEEYVSAPGENTLSAATRTLAKPHGWVFEVPADGAASAQPLVALGQFKHEAACVDPDSGIVYLTEDQPRRSGFYRMIPTRRGELQRGGRLQMLQAVGVPDLRRGRREGERLAVRWIDIAEPERGIDADGGEFGVLRQGIAGGASMFTRLEGCFAGDGRIWFTSTDGGDAGCGQVWAYDPRGEALQLVFESPGAAVLDHPDNLILSPRGGLLICEDSDQVPQRLWGLVADGGGLFEFCRNDIRLDGQMGFAGDFRDGEWCGACFSPDGRWLFANVQEPGLSVAITGPWRAGLI